MNEMNKVNKKLELDNDSLMFLINNILNSIKEDRELSLDQFNFMNQFLTGAGDTAGTDIVLLSEHLSEAINKHLAQAAKSTESAIKVAKIMADNLAKTISEESFTEADRDLLEELTKTETELEEERQTLSVIQGELSNGSKRQ